MAENPGIQSMVAKGMLLQLQYISELPTELGKKQILIQQFKMGPRFCIPMSFHVMPADTVDVGNTL